MLVSPLVGGSMAGNELFGAYRDARRGLESDVVE